MTKTSRLGSAVLLCLLATAVAHAASWHHLNDVVLFDPDVSGVQGWEQPRGLTLAADAGVLKLNIQQPDPSIVRRGLNLDPGMVEWLHVRYRASGFRVKETRGELFYENAAHGFADLQYVVLPALVTDGQWQDLWVNLPRAMRGAASDWWDNGPVKALRLDLVDEAPGSIEVGALRLTAQRDDLLLPEQARALTRWEEPYGLSFQQQPGVLALDIRERDCRLYSADVPLDPAAARYFVLRYRAWGFADPQTTGQVFYANSRHDIEAGYCLPITSLTTDGQWHDRIIDTAEALGRGYQDWVFGGPITKLRLDLVDQAPGKAELALVLTTSRLQVTSAADLILPAGRHYLLPASAFAPGVDSAQARPRACALTLPMGQYSVWLRVVDVPQTYEALRHVTMTGTPRAPVTGGGTGKLIWVRLGSASGGALTITRPAEAGVRLDAVLIAEGTTPPQDRPVAALQPVTSTVRPLTPRRLTLLRPYWQGDMLACPQPGEKDEQLQSTRTVFRRSFEAPADLASAWLQISVDDYFRLTLNGEQIAENLKPDSWMTPTLLDVTARLKPGQANCVAVAAYNLRGAEGVLFDLVMNRPDHTFARVVSDDKWRCSGTAPAGWTAPAFDDTAWAAPVLQPGPPNSPWVVTIPYVNKVWEPPTRLLSLTAKPIVPAGESQEFTCRFGSDKPVGAGDVLVATLTCTDTGKRLLEREFPLQAAQCRPGADGSVTVAGLGIPISRWYPSMPLELKVDLRGRSLAEAPERAVRFAFRSAAPPANLTSEVRVMGGVPRLLVNGKPFFAMVGNGEGRDREGTAEAYKAGNFSVAAIWVDPLQEPQWWTGPDQYEFARVDELLIEQLDRNPAALVLPIIWAAPPPWWAERYPEEIARFSDGTAWTYYKSTHSFNSQRWRADATRALTAFVRHVEQSTYASRILGYWVIGGVSAEWQGWGCHGSAVDKHLMDYSAPEQAAFQGYLKAHYPNHPEWAQAGIPDLATRLGRELGVFRDPAQAGPSIAYNRMYSDSVVDSMLACVGAAKAATGRRKIAGAYFGYSLEYANMDWCLQMSGHNNVRRALDSPDLDFLSAPHSYAVRRLGEDMGWMWAAASINRAGKLFWPDDDSRTHLSGAADYSPTINPAQTRETLRRNLGKELCHLNPVGFLQIESGRELGSPAIARDCRITRRAGEFALRTGVRRRAEIAAVIDEDSVKYLSYDYGRFLSGELDPVTAWNGDQWFQYRPVNNLAAELIGYQRGRLARIGAPVDVMLLSDFRKRPLNYKLYVMLSCCQYDDATLAAVRRQIQQRGATVLWCYAPGFIKDETADVRHMQALTGFNLQLVPGPATPVVNVTNLRSPLTGAGLQTLSFGAPYELRPLFAVQDPAAETLGVYRDTGQVALAAKQVGRSRSVFCGSHILPPDLLRNLARVAGVHIYCDSGDVLHANDSFVLLHTSSAGEKTIRLPRRGDVVDVYEGKVLFRNVDSFTINEAAQTTRLLYVGKADQFLRAMDYRSL
jgi:hypothetical protein